MKIAGTVAIVTGAASGMGAATAKLLASQGAHVVMADANIDLCRQTAKAIDGHAVQCDVTASTDVEKVIDAAKALGSIRILVNCAGIVCGQRVVGKQGALPLADFSRVINVNLIGTFNMLRLAAEAMTQTEPLEQNQRGVIINTASIAAFEGQIGQAAYSASKGGVVALTLPIARELAQFGIRVMTIAPGLVETPMLMGLSDKVRASLADKIPFPKCFAKPDSFARLAQHIIENDVLNGEVIRMDGALRLD